MTTKLTKPVSRLVPDTDGEPLIATLTATGIQLRRPRHRQGKLVPYTLSESSDELTHPQVFQVKDANGDLLKVTLTVDGIVFQRPGSRESYLLPFKHGETRAHTLAAGGVGIATKARRRNVPRGLLATERASNHE